MWEKVPPNERDTAKIVRAKRVPQRFCLKALSLYHIRVFFGIFKTNHLFLVQIRCLIPLVRNFNPNYVEINFVYGPTIGLWNDDPDVKWAKGALCQYEFNFKGDKTMYVF